MRHAEIQPQVCEVCCPHGDTCIQSTQLSLLGPFNKTIISPILKSVKSAKSGHILECLNMPIKWRMCQVNART